MDAVEQLLDLVRRLEPHLTPSNLLVDLRIDRDLVRFHRAGHITEGSTAPGPKPVQSFAALSPCDTCLPREELLDGLVASLDDRNLNQAVTLLQEFNEIRAELRDRADRRDPALRSGDEFIRLRALDEAAVRYLTDNITLGDARDRLLANPALPQHKHLLEQLDDLWYDTRQGLLSPEHGTQIALLRAHVQQDFDVSGEDTETLLQLAPVYEFPAFGDAGYFDDLDSIDAHAATLPLTLRVLFGHEHLMRMTVAVMPLWAARTIKLLKPAMVRSSLHAGLPPKVGETALKLWSDDPADLYHHLDHCVSAAHRLVGEDESTGPLPGADGLATQAAPRP